jgi:hypothetical protein
MSAEKMTPREKMVQDAFEEAGIGNRRPVRGTVAKINGSYYPIKIIKTFEDGERAYVEILMGASRIRRFPLSWEREGKGNGWISTKTIFVDGKKYVDTLADGPAEILADLS